MLVVFAYSQLPTDYKWTLVTAIKKLNFIFWALGLSFQVDQLGSISELQQ